MKDWTGVFLSEELKNRKMLQLTAAKLGEKTENFVTRFPKHRLYMIREGAEYSKTTPGCLMVITDYKFDKIEGQEEPDEEPLVRCQIVRDSSETWATQFAYYWLRSADLQRVDEEKFGVEIST